MPRQPLRIVISGADALECAQALEYRGHMEAGQSQQPDLFSKEDTTWWFLAKRIRQGINEARLARKAGTKTADELLLQRALGALEYHVAQTRPITNTTQTIEALRARLRAL